MELIFRAKFYRDFRKIRSREILRIATETFRRVERAKSIEAIGSVKKIRDYTHYYRVKIKVANKLDYRLVFTIRGNKDWAERITPVKKVFYKR